MRVHVWPDAGIGLVEGHQSDGYTASLISLIVSGCSEMIRAIRHYFQTQKHSPSEYRIAPSTALTLLQNERRRAVLRELTTSEPDLVPVRDLATAIACKENGVTEDNLTSDQRKRVYISLFQSHLPKLASEEVIEYDADRGTVRNTEVAKKLASAERAFRQKLGTN